MVSVNFGSLDGHSSRPQPPASLSSRTRRTAWRDRVRFQVGRLLGLHLRVGEAQSSSSRTQLCEQGDFQSTALVRFILRAHVLLLSGEVSVLILLGTITIVALFH
jgi:hypothetical protein